jgi:hypothetical protein
MLEKMAPSGDRCSKNKFPLVSLGIIFRNKVLSENIPVETLSLAIISRGT